MRAPDTPASPVLHVLDVGVAFGGVRALNGVSCVVNDGELCGLVGPNGAGKTTLFNCITRLYSVSQGEIRFLGKDITSVRKREVVGLGIARTFQNLGVYGQMSVLDNILVGMHHARTVGFFTPLINPARTQAEERRAIDWCREILRELNLDHLAHHKASDLPYGTLKRLEVARALAAKPRLLLLDEPAAGLTQGEVLAFGDMLLRVKERFALTVLLVEHNMRLVMRLCERIVVLHLGSKLAEGTPAQIQGNAQVVAAYLGGAVK